MHINQNLDESISILLSFSLAYRFVCFLYLVFVALNRLNHISFPWNVGWLTVRFPGN